MDIQNEASDESVERIIKIVNQGYGNDAIEKSSPLYQLESEDISLMRTAENQ